MKAEAPDLAEQYRLAIEEYRFQVDLNWRRSEYFFVLNIGVLIAASTLSASELLPRALVGMVFGLGALLVTRLRSSISLEQASVSTMRSPPIKPPVHRRGLWCGLPTCRATARSS